jgi:signal transduction histidine kinase
VRRRLIGAFVSIIILMLVIQDIPLFGYLDNMEHTQIYTSLERDAWRLADNVDTGIETKDLKGVQTVITNYLKTAESGARVIVTDENGVVLASSDMTDIGEDYTNRPEVVAAITGKAATGERQSETLKDELVYTAVPIEDSYRIIGTLRISFSGKAIDELVSNRIRGLVVVGFLTIFITLIATVIIANAITERLRRIQRATSEVAMGNLELRLNNMDSGDPTSAPEVRQLEQAFDFMVERLKTVLDSQRSFASDASHQLRTPLTALRLKLENAAAVVDNPDASADAIEAASAEVVRLQMLVDGLLALARLEGSNPQLEHIDVTNAVNTKAELWMPLAQERNIRLIAKAAPNLQAAATPMAVDQILDAYLDNALDFTPDGGTITISAKQVEDRIEVEVIDEGPGISPADATKAFNRFWRGRSDDSGTGLGLAIVARLAAVIGAQVSLRPASNKGGTIAQLSMAKSNFS